MIVETESGSQYEIDRQGRRARRLTSKIQTARSPAGVWRNYAAMHGPVVGQSMLIQWADETLGLPAAPGAAPGTITTPVVSITE